MYRFDIRKNFKTNLQEKYGFFFPLKGLKLGLFSSDGPGTNHLRITDF